MVTISNTATHVKALWTGTIDTKIVLFFTKGYNLKLNQEKGFSMD